MKVNFIVCTLVSSLLVACVSNINKPPVTPPFAPVGNADKCKGENCNNKDNAESPELDIHKIQDDVIRRIDIPDAEASDLGGTIYFSYNMDEVKPEYRPIIERNVKHLKQTPGSRVRLIGSTDERGSREYNLSLGQRRAVAVKRIMNLLGIKDDQIDTYSYGEEKPVCSESDDSCWAKNRRTEINYANE